MHLYPPLSLAGGANFEAWPLFDEGNKGVLFETDDQLQSLAQDAEVLQAEIYAIFLVVDRLAPDADSKLGDLPWQRLLELNPVPGFEGIGELGLQILHLPDQKRRLELYNRSGEEGYLTAYATLSATTLKGPLALLIFFDRGTNAMAMYLNGAKLKMNYVLSGRPTLYSVSPRQLILNSLSGAGRVLWQELRLYKYNLDHKRINALFQQANERWGTRIDATVSAAQSLGQDSLTLAELDQRVRQVLTSSCAGCHDAERPLTVYSGAAISLAVKNESMPQGGPPLSKFEKEEIAAWAKAGGAP